MPRSRDRLELFPSPCEGEGQGVGETGSKIDRPTSLAHFDPPSNSLPAMEGEHRAALAQYPLVAQVFAADRSR